MLQPINENLSKAKSKANKKKTPLMQQYGEVKAKHPDALLLFRVGDFYETFGDDAIKASDALGIVLTKRNNGGSDIALAGFPYHSMDVYLPKLVKAGYRVAICEQLEKPSKEKKIVKRGVTDIITPGVTIHDNILDGKSNNFLVSVAFQNSGNHGIALIDVSTGEFLVSEGNMALMEKLIQSFNPAEIIISKDQRNTFEKQFGSEYYLYCLDEWIYTKDYSRELLLDHFKVKNLKGYGIESMEPAQTAAGAIFHYLSTTQNADLKHINKVQRIPSESFMWMDRFTVRSLELVQSNHASGIPLIDVLDRTVTPMGARNLKKWILLPLIDLSAIHLRQKMIQHFVEKESDLEPFDEALKSMGDLERLATKVAMLKIGPREILQLKRSLSSLAELKTLLHDTNNKTLADISKQIDLCSKLYDRIDQEISDEAPAVQAKGGIFKLGFNEEHDELKNLLFNSKELLLDIQSIEAEKTGIANLKIGFNNVFGYYLEVTNKYKNQGLIPEHWVRKQTLTNAERYITDELKKLESKILGAEEKLLALEEKLYEDLLRYMAGFVHPLLQNAQYAAQTDCVISLAKTAIKNHYCLPSVNDSYSIKIKSGRHPVIEQHLAADESYIPNDIFLSNDDQQIIMITGPNMSGKSAVLRQTALICLMAQMGSYVPAASAEIGFIDKLFTRVGASDNISSGESTFMVEMNETSSIMNNISERSLILLDEIGRGTSTYDGISIAWSLAEYLHENKIARPKTLFATHYHELNELSKKFERIKNFHITTREVNNKVIFLRKLMEGGSAHSFGVHVAQMAGMPATIIQRAHEILHHLEQKSKNLNTETETTAKPNFDDLPIQNTQLNIFETSDPKATQLRLKIQELNLNNLTPIQCMMKLNEFIEFLQED